jgi:hypothetical protein
MIAAAGANAVSTSAAAAVAAPEPCHWLPLPPVVHGVLGVVTAWLLVEGQQLITIHQQAASSICDTQTV